MPVNFNLPFLMPLGYLPSDYAKIKSTVSLFGSLALGQASQRALWSKKTRKLHIGVDDRGLTGWVCTLVGQVL